MLRRFVAVTISFQLFMGPAFAESSGSSGSSHGSGIPSYSGSMGSASAASSNGGEGAGFAEAPVTSVADSGATGNFMTRDETSGMGRGSEFISGYYKGAVLMEVNLWGGVQKPGVHHVPMKMDLVTFLSLAGGPSRDAEVDSITIARRNRTTSEIIKVDLEELLSDPSAPRPMLQANDTINVPVKKPLIGENTLAAIGLVSAALGIVISGLLISDRLARP